MIQAITIVSIIALALSAWPIYRLVVSAWSTALRSTSLWVAVAGAAWLGVAGATLFEPQPGDWQVLRWLRLASSILLLAPIVAVLGARRPGDTIWNFIVVSLLIVFSLPLLEQWVLGKEIEPGRAALDAPRLVLYGTVAFVGVLNYLPTRFAASAVLFAFAVAVDMSGMGPWPAHSAQAVMRHALAATALALSAWSAWWSATAPPRSNGVEQWIWMRHAWGFIWAARLQERWNAAALQHQWKMRLRSDGLSRLANDPADPPTERQAMDYLQRLLRRFLYRDSRDH